MIINKKKISIIMLILTILIGYNFSSIHAYLSKVQSKYYYQNAIQISSNSKMGESIYTIESLYEVSIYNLYYQEEVANQISTLMDHTKQSNTPLMLYNAFGTNTSSFYFSFFANEKYSVEYSIHAEDNSIEDFTQEAVVTKTDDGVYAAQLIGFVPDMKNLATINIKNDNEIINTYSYTINMPKNVLNVQTQLETSELSQGQPLSDGLYAMFGLDKSFNSNIYLFDNNGVLRSELPLENYRSDRIIFDETTMIYSYRKSGLMKVNNLGRIIDFYDFDGYTQHHDFIYDKDNDKFLILVNKEGEDTIEDYVISIDATSKEVEEIADMESLLPSLYAQAKSPEEGNTYGGDELDWIHLNSLSLDGNNLILSARELSTIIKLSNIYDKAKIDYMIADENLYKDSEFKEYILDKDGDFISQAGQHTLTYQEDGSLQDGQYYLSMYNNNFTSSRTRQDIDWSIIDGAGTYTKGVSSYYYKYLVDENNNSYSLVKKIAIPYSSIVSSVQEFENGNIITSSGMATCFNEYDQEGNLIQQFNYDAEKYAYRVFKYTFEDVYFE